MGLSAVTGQQSAQQIGIMTLLLNAEPVIIAARQALNRL